MDQQAGQEQCRHGTDEDEILRRAIGSHFRLPDSTDMQHDELGTLRRDGTKVKSRLNWASRPLMYGYELDRRGEGAYRSEL
jgi:hypothetical protein